MPALLMLFGKAMDKTRHRRFVPKINFVGRFAYASRYVMPIFFVILVAGGYYMVQRVNYAYGMDMVPAFRQTEMEEAKEEIRDRFGTSNAVALIVPSGNFGAERALLEELSACPEVKCATGLASIPAMDGYCIGDEVDYAEFAAIAGVDETSAQALFAYYAAENGDHRAVREDLSGYRVSLLDMFLFLHDRMEAGDVELDDPDKLEIGSAGTQVEMLQRQLRYLGYPQIEVTGKYTSQEYLAVGRIQNALGVSVTGFAGPDSAPDGRPAGLIYVGINSAHGTAVRELNTGRGGEGSRDYNRFVAASNALHMVLEELNGRGEKSEETA